MAEILNLLFNPLPNAIMTALTGLSLLYWLFSMLMGDGFDFGTDAEIQFEGADIQDVDIPDDADLDTEVAKEPSFIAKAMDYINMGKAPMMVIVTLFKFIGWVITIASSLALNLASYGWKSVFILVPIFIITFFLMHYVTIPVVKLYKKVGYMGEEAHDFLGRSGRMKSSIQGDSLGAVELIINKDVIRLHVKSINGEKINYGDQVSIIREDNSKRFYYVQKEVTLDTLL